VKATDLLSACFLVFGALLVWPLISIANRQALVVGVPSLVLYLFLVWGAIVGVLAWVAARAGGDDP
jgi:hypothetical protein